MENGIKYVQENKHNPSVVIISNMISNIYIETGS